MSRSIDAGRFLREHAPKILFSIVGIMLIAACTSSNEPQSPTPTLIPTRALPALAATSTKALPTITPTPQAADPCLFLKEIGDAGTLTKNDRSNMQVQFQMIGYEDGRKTVENPTRQAQLLWLKGSLPLLQQVQQDPHQGSYLHASVYPDELYLSAKVESALASDGIKLSCHTTHTVKNIPQTLGYTTLESFTVDDCTIKCNKNIWQVQQLPPVTPIP